MQDEKCQRLEALQTLREQPFRSQVPLIGPAIAWFRNQWNSISTKWYVRGLIAQQNDFNRAVVEQLRGHNTNIRRLETQVEEQQARLDEMSAQFESLQKRLDRLSRNLNGYRSHLESLDAQAETSVARIEAVGPQVEAYQRRMQEYEAWLVEQDRGQARIIHDMAELSAQVARRIREMESLQEQIAHLEAGQHVDRSKG